MPATGAGSTLGEQTACSVFYAEGNRLVTPVVIRSENEPGTIPQITTKQDSARTVVQVLPMSELEERH